MIHRAALRVQDDLVHLPRTAGGCHFTARSYTAVIQFGFRTLPPLDNTLAWPY